MSNPIPPGSTGVRRKFKLLDDAGLALDGKNAASLPDIYYNVTGAASVKITLVDLTAATDPWTSGGVWGLGRGEYSIDVPDAAFAAAALEVTLSGEATGMHVICEPIKVGYVSSNAVQIGGAAPGSATIGTVGTVTNAVTVSGNVTVGGYAAGKDPIAKWTSAITESYAAKGAAPTPEQALMMILQLLTELGISGTTETIKKLDQATTAMTFTLNDATSPTSVTRAT